LGHGGCALRPVWVAVGRSARALRGQVERHRVFRGECKLMARRILSLASGSTRLPNGLDVASLHDDDTLMVYRDIFEDDCYRRYGITIEDGDCILDVGANTGLFVLFLNSIVREALVHAFEPAPATFDVLRRNVARHDRLGTRIHNVGLSDRVGMAELTHYPRLSNASTLHPDETAQAVSWERAYVLERFDELSWPLAGFLRLWPRPARAALAEVVRRFYRKKQTVPCELRTLSEVIAREGIDHIDLLKVDAEGSEEAILTGLGDGDWGRVRQVVVEVHGGDAAVEAMGERLASRGFRVKVGPNPTFPRLSLVYGIRRAA
jgi:FkbM family methyltransferase